MTTASQARWVFTYSRTCLTYALSSAVASSESFTLHAKIVGFIVSRKSGVM